MQINDLLTEIENSSKNINENDENAEEKIKDIIGKNILMKNIESLSLDINNVEYIQQFINQEIENKNKDEKKDYELGTFCLYYWIEIIALYINLIGVYQIIIIMNSLFEIIKQDILFRFTSTKKITFFDALIKLSLRDFQEIKIEMWSSIIGEIILESLGFEISCAIFFFLL